VFLKRSEKWRVAVAVKTLPWEAIRSKSYSLKKSIKKEEAKMTERGGSLCL
jgi:hypothetical protein